MSHTGTQILYRIVHRDPRWLLERRYAPWLNMEGRMRALGLPLATDFDVFGFTLQGVHVPSLYHVPEGGRTHDLTVIGPNELLVEVATSSDGSAKSTEVMQALLALAPEDVLRLHIHKVRASGSWGEPPDARAIARAEVLTLETGNPDQWELAGNARGHSGGRSAC